MKNSRFLLLLPLLLSACSSSPGEYFETYDDYHAGKATTMKTYFDVKETGDHIHSFWRIDVCDAPNCQSMTYDAYDKDGKSIKTLKTHYTVDCDELEYQQGMRQWFGGHGKMLFWSKPDQNSESRSLALRLGPEQTSSDFAPGCYTLQ